MKDQSRIRSTHTQTVVKQISELERLRSTAPTRLAGKSLSLPLLRRLAISVVTVRGEIYQVLVNFRFSDFVVYYFDHEARTHARMHTHTYTHKHTHTRARTHTLDTCMHMLTPANKSISNRLPNPAFHRRFTISANYLIKSKASCIMANKRQTGRQRQPCRQPHLNIRGSDQ